MPKARLLDDKRTHELIEEYEAEARTRKLSPAWARAARIFGVAVSLLAIYYAMAAGCRP